MLALNHWTFCARAGLEGRARLDACPAAGRAVRAAVIALLVLATVPALAASQTADQSDPVAALLVRLEQTIRDGAPARYLDLLAQTADREAAGAFAEAWIVTGATRAVVRERDRGPMAGVLPDDGYALLVEVFVEFGPRARVSTWRLDVRRRASGDWGIVSQQVLTTLQGLYKLTLNPRRQIVAKDLVVSAEDIALTVPDATLFVAEADGAPTAVVVLGRGDMAFTPAPAAERSQLRVLYGADSMQSPFDGAFLRVNPVAFDTRLTAREMTDRPTVDPRDLKRADEIFRQEVAKSFGLELADLSSEIWSMLPGTTDLLAEIRTRRFDTVTYTRSATEIEDISVFDRKKGRNISVYSSRANLAHYTKFYSEDDKADFVVRSYELDVYYDPPRERLQGVAKLSIEIAASSVSSLTLKLKDGLDVQGIRSAELGRLLAVRVRNQSSVVINLPSTLLRGFRFGLEIAYGGRIEPQPIDSESAAVAAAQEQELDEFEMPLQESFLFSNRSFWYPQAPVLGYAPAEIRMTLDEPWMAVASGQLLGATLAPGVVERGVRRREYTFTVRRPVRYLTFLVGRLSDTLHEKISGHGPEIDLQVVTNPRQRGRAKGLAKDTSNILKFFGSLVGEFPYEGITVAAVERRLPGGHSPAYLALLAVQGPVSPLRWADDPGALPFPEFFLTHELAHQWWGQAVGWKNYHEQWLSEGFAQYFSALYAEHARGRETFDTIIRRMQAWAIDASSQGSVFLGYRIGHVKGDSRLFRAVVYNKGAMVLHMLRGLVGDEKFFAGLRRFYETWRFKKAGTDDFRLAMEAETGLALTSFFDQWILGDAVPQVALSWRIVPGSGNGEVVVRLEQAGDPYQMPVTVTLEYDDNSTTNSVVKLTGKTLEVRMPLTKKLRRVDVNRDKAAVAVFRVVAGS
jgi:hypothetical protein